MTTIAEHTIDETLLPKKNALILDAGCLNGEFSGQFAFDHIVFAVDLAGGEDDVWDYAIGGHNGMVGIVKTDDRQGWKVGAGDEVEMVTIQEFSRRFDVEFWDIIKLDIEGSEIDAILAMNRPMAKQITVEFHLHCGQTKEEVQKAVDHLHQLGYRTIQHELTDQHCAGLNFWNSLFIL